MRQTIEFSNDIKKNKAEEFEVGGIYQYTGTDAERLVLCTNVGPADNEFSGIDLHYKYTEKDVSALTLALSPMNQEKHISHGYVKAYFKPFIGTITITQEN